jgi:hypothetical protein
LKSHPAVARPEQPRGRTFTRGRPHDRLSSGRSTARVGSPCRRVTGPLL